MLPKPEGYLENHLEEPVSEETQLSASTGVDQPMIQGLEIDYSAQNEVHSENNGLTFDMSYSRLPHEQAEAIRMKLHDSYNRAKSDNERQRIGKMIKYYSSPVYNVEKFNMTKEMDKGEAVLDLDELREIGPASISFNPKMELGVNDLDKDGLFSISGDLNNLGTILAILHETGHNVDPTEVVPAAQARYSHRESITDKEATTILKNERNAWAFAIRKIQPFLDEKQMAAAKDFMYKYCLSYYSENIRKQLAPTWKLLVPHLIELFEGSNEGPLPRSYPT